MKNFRLCAAYLAVFMMIFTSCSRDEEPTNESEMATLSFGAVVNDLMEKASVKQAIGDLPACSDDTPSYVRIVLMQGGTAVVGTTADPYRVDLVAGQIFTEEDAALELEPGTYSLDHFSVYNADDELIWIAPRAGSELADFVDSTLPLSISLGAGVKKYVDVPVLCFDDREVNEYGYLFFELDTNSAYEFCFFANFCDDTERHFTANYSLDVWLGTDATGTPLYTDLQPVIGVNEDGDFFAEPVCMALPMNDDADEEYIYYEMTLLSWEDNYGTAPSRVISGTLSRSDIEANFGPGDEIEYEHIRFDCPPGGQEPGGPQCLPNITGDCERVIFMQEVNTTGLPTGQNPSYPIFTEDEEEVGTITYILIDRTGARDLLTARVALDDGWIGTNARFTLPNVDEDDVCVNNINSATFDLVYEAQEVDYPVRARVAINICPE